MKQVNVRLTLPEADHLLTLLRDAQERGEYYGNREQYWNRHGRIRNKLLEAAGYDAER